MKKMTKFYKKVDNCGPVPYPDGTNNFLTDGIVSGPGWEDLVEIGYVEEVVSPILEALAEAAQDNLDGVGVPVPEATDEVGAQVSAPDDSQVETEEDQEVDENGINDRAGTEGLDPTQNGSPDVVPGAGTSPPGRRGRRSKKVV